MKPKSLLDRSFRYTPSFATNVKNTFAKARREMKKAQPKAPHTAQGDIKPNVVPMDRKRTAR